MSNRKTMARQPKRCRLNGARCRRPMREVGALSRWMHLYHDEVSQLHHLQFTRLRNILCSQSSLTFLSHLVMIHALLSNDLVHQVAATTAKTIIECLIQLLNQPSRFVASAPCPFCFLAQSHVLRHPPRRRIPGSSVQTSSKHHFCLLGQSEMSQLHKFLQSRPPSDLQPIWASCFSGR